MSEPSEQQKPDWRITLDKDGMADAPLKTRQQRGAHLPPAGMDTDKMRSPALYQPDAALIDAIHAAVILGQPLLLTGEPGCGKTEVAHFVAYQFNLFDQVEPPAVQEYALRFDVKSTTTARDLFYTYDTVGRFGAVYENSPNNPKPLPDRSSFVTLNALGIAVAESAPWRDVYDLRLKYRHESDGPRRRVVLIDEIDKAPRDVPNDLLMEFERLTFYIPELDRTIRADREKRPILIITSNSERALPDAFLRRCVFYIMPFPDRDRLSQIVQARIPGFSAGIGLEKSALDLLYALRRARLAKRPGIAELLGFLTVLLAQNFKPEESLPSDGGNWENLARVTLLKTTDDQRQFRNAGDFAKLLKEPPDNRKSSPT
jgi:MoxR-like ATPase